MSLLLSRTPGYCYHLSKFHIYALVYCIYVGRWALPISPIYTGGNGDLLRFTEADLGFHTQTEPNVQPHRKALGFITRSLFINTCLFNDYKDNDDNSAFSIMPSA